MTTTLTVISASSDSVTVTDPVNSWSFKVSREGEILSGAETMDWFGDREERYLSIGEISARLASSVDALSEWSKTAALGDSRAFADILDEVEISQER